MLLLLLFSTIKIILHDNASKFLYTCSQWVHSYINYFSFIGLKTLVDTNFLSKLVEIAQ